MRIFKLAIYVFAALATFELSCRANATDATTVTPMKAIASKTSAKEEFTRFQDLVKKQRDLRVQVPKAPHRSITSSPHQHDRLAQATTLSDIQGNWAQSFIEALAARDIISGFPDGTFRPDGLVTRAEFAAMIQKAFQKNPVGGISTFADVPANYWASEAIQAAFQMGFLQGYPGNVFNPDHNIPRVQALVSLANGLDLSPKAEPLSVLDASFQDAAQIPEFARTPVAAATENRFVVNYPNVAVLNPNQVATRADVAAFIYQALVNSGQVPQLSATDIAAPYIVGYQPPAPASPPPTTPEQVAQLREQFRLPEPPVVEIVRTGTLGGSSIGSPTAFGADWGSAFVGASFQSRTRDTDRSDGAVSAGFGLGDAREAVGLEVVVSVVDLIDDTFEDGTVSFKLHRLLSNDLAIALGVENAIIWGSTDGGTSAYGVVSKAFQLKENPVDLFSRLTVSLGVGSGRFRFEDDVEDDADTVNVFASAGIQVAEPVSLIADWTGQDLNLGASIVPFRGTPLIITPGIADVTGNAGDGVRFILGIGYAIKF